MRETARLNMLTLPLEPTDDRADPAFKDEAGCAEWLKQFQLTNLQRAHSTLLTQAGEFNRYPMRGLERLNTLERLRETIHHVQNDYARKLIAKPLPLNDSELLVFVAIVQLWQTVVSGYQRCLQAFIDGDSQLARHGALLSQRCLLYSGQAIFEHLRTGYEFDAKLWQQLHKLYAFAEQRGLHLEEIPDTLSNNSLNNTPLNAGQPRSNCQGIYVKTLLACYARPAELTRSQLQLLDSWLTQWSSAVSVERSFTASKGDAQPLALDLDNTNGLRQVTLVTHGGSVRYLAMVPLSKLLRVKTILLQQGKTPQQLELGDYNRDDCIGLLIFLHQCWCENRSIRSNQRSPASKHVQLCHRLESIHAQLSGHDQDGMGLPVETWLVQNESMLGARLACEHTPAARLSPNQLLALRFGGAETLILGTTIWASVTRGGQLRIGVRYLPGAASAVGLHISDADIPLAGNPAPAFLLQASPALNTPASLIIPRDCFKPGRVGNIRHQNGKNQQAKMGFSVERWADYERISFTLV